MFFKPWQKFKRSNHCLNHCLNDSSVVCNCFFNNYFLPTKLIDLKRNRDQEYGGLDENVKGLQGKERSSSVRKLWQHNLSDPSYLASDSITEAVIKFPNDTQHHCICKRQRQKHKFNVAVLELLIVVILHCSWYVCTVCLVTGLRGKQVWK